MKKFLVIAAVALALSGCATFKNIGTAWQVLTTAAATPQQIIIAGNTFDALEATATAYLAYCKSVSYKPQPCAIGNRRPVVAAVRAGRAARNSLEPYVTADKAGPSVLFNTLVTAITTLQRASMPVVASGS